MDATRIAAELEAELGCPVLDSISVTLWGVLEALKLDKAPWRDWGRIFTL
jgi:maleate cis-trans isomerase